MNPELKALIEGLKDMLRVVLVGIIPVIISGISLDTGAITINWNKVIAVGLVVFLTAILKGSEKGSHVYNKETNPEPGKPQGFLGV